jgi:TolB-like protein
MNKLFLTLLLLALAAYGQVKERVAIINTLDDRDSIGFSELTYLTDRLRETAVNVLPADKFGVMTTESIVAFLGSMENTVKACKEASCLAELGRKVSADYVAQGRIGRFNEDLTIKVELYNVTSGNLMSSFTGYFKDMYSLLALIDEKAPDLFKKMLVESKAIEVEKPELAKVEPVPAKPEVVVVQKPVKTSFYVAVGLDLVGAGMFVAGFLRDQNLTAAYDKYKKDEYNKANGQADFDNAWSEAEKVQTQRNVFYIVGGVLLASGIGVHIWF